MESGATKIGKTGQNDKGALSSLAMEVWLFLLRNEMKVARLQMRRFSKLSLSSTAPIVAKGGPVLSMTSYGERLKTVHLVIESIGAGSMLPSRVILWVDTQKAFDNPSAELQRLVKRGLEIGLSENYGPHTKYYPYLLSTDSFDTPLVTADDDQLYTSGWLEGLVEANRDYPDDVNCYRAHRIGVATGPSGDTLAPYDSWTKVRSTVPSFLNFLTGVSGCIYPPSLLSRLKAAGTEFMALCPKSDDAWLHLLAMRTGVKVRQIYNRPLRFPTVPGSQASGLFQSNVLQSHNDKQLQKTYNSSDIAILRAAAAHET